MESSWVFCRSSAIPARYSSNPSAGIGRPSGPARARSSSGSRRTVFFIIVIITIAMMVGLGAHAGTRQSARRLLVLGTHVATTAAEQPETLQLLPLRVGPDFHPAPTELQRIRDCIQDAADAGNFRLAASLQDLLFVAEPKPPLTLEACSPESPDECLEFFLREGFVCIRNLFSATEIQSMQSQWRQAQ